MKLLEYPKFCHQLYSIHEAIRRFGFKSDDIYVSVNNVIPHGKNILCVELITQGNNFIIPVTSCGDERDKMLKTWKSFIHVVVDPNTTEQDLENSFLSTPLGSDPMAMVTLAGTLSKRGFKVPAIPDGGKSMERFAEEQRGLSKGGEA